jgi:hypothetical protein
VETQIDVPGEGRFILAAKAKKLDTGCMDECWWSYEYALYNMNSDRSAGGFRVALPPDLPLGSNSFRIPTDNFHDVDYHDGDGAACPSCLCTGGSNPDTPCNTDMNCTGGGVCQAHCDGGYNHGALCSGGKDCRVCVGGPVPGTACIYDGDCGTGGACPAGGQCTGRLNFDGTPWSSFVDEQSHEVRWTTFATTPPENANALRWGTLYNFRFEAKRAPSNYCTHSVTIDLFKPGTPSFVTGPSVVPMPLQAPAPSCPALLAPQNASINPKTRVLSVIPARCASPTAIRVKMIDLQNPVPTNAACCPPQDFHAWDVGSPASCPSCTAEGCPADPSGQGGCARWVGKPGTFLESQGNAGLGNFRGARLQCTPFYYDWSTDGVVHVTGAEIIPSSTYSVQLIAEGCMVSNEASYSPALEIKTARHGDIAPEFSPSPGQPNAIDIASSVNKFKNLGGAPPKIIAQIQPNFPDPNGDLGALDIAAVVDNVKNLAYPFSGPCACPSTVPCGVTACPGTPSCVTLYGAGATCVKTCTSGPKIGLPCNNAQNCGSCVGGGNAGLPCDLFPFPTSDCPGGTCDVGVCGAAFCRDRCGRCSP